VLPGQAVGIGIPDALHGSGYVQPWMVVIPLAVSAALYQPSPTLIECVALAVSVGGGNVATVPVAVYSGSSEASAGVSIPFNEVGGHWPNAAVALGANVPAPAPPVCQGR
jgi:hypothetical protein